MAYEQDIWTQLPRLCRHQSAWGLDVERLHKCMAIGVDASKVQDDSFDVAGQEVDGGPVVFLNGKRMHGLINRWTISEAVDALHVEGGPEPPVDIIDRSSQCV